METPTQAELKVEVATAQGDTLGLTVKAEGQAVARYERYLTDLHSKVRTRDFMRWFRQAMPNMDLPSMGKFPESFKRKLKERIREILLEDDGFVVQTIITLENTGNYYGLAGRKFSNASLYRKLCVVAGMKAFLEGVNAVDLDKA